MSENGESIDKSKYHELRVIFKLPRHADSFEKAMWLGNMVFEREDNKFSIFSENYYDLNILDRKLSIQVERHGIELTFICEANLIKNKELKTKSEKLQEILDSSQEMMKQIESFSKLCPTVISNNILQQYLKKGINND